MIKNIIAAVFFAFISYAIVSDLGKPQHSYFTSNPIAVVD